MPQYKNTGLCNIQGYTKTQWQSWDGTPRASALSILGTNDIISIVPEHPQSLMYVASQHPWEVEEDNYPFNIHTPGELRYREAK